LNCFFRSSVFSFYQSQQRVLIYLLSNKTKKKKYLCDLCKCLGEEKTEEVNDMIINCKPLNTSFNRQITVAQTGSRRQLKDFFFCFQTEKFENPKNWSSKT
jgi:hypothetical protein